MHLQFLSSVAKVGVGEGGTLVLRKGENKKGGRHLREMIKRGRLAGGCGKDDVQQFHSVGVRCGARFGHS
jgi:hypothetical protein